MAVFLMSEKERVLTRREDIQSTTLSRCSGMIFGGLEFDFERYQV